MSTEAQSLRPHAFYFFVKCLHFFIAPRALRFRRITGAHLFERFLHGKLGDFSHGDPSYLKTECPTGKLSDDKNGCFLTSHVLRFLCQYALVSSDIIGQSYCPFHIRGLRRICLAMAETTHQASERRPGFMPGETFPLIRIALYFGL